jgi:phospholipid transport system transporter-binding protein
MIRQDGERYRVEGPVTLESVASLLDEGLGVFQGARPVVDFGGVDKVDSAALSLMLEWNRRLGAQGRAIAYTNLGPSLLSLARLYGIADLIPIAAE